MKKTLLQLAGLLLFLGAGLVIFESVVRILVALQSHRLNAAGTVTEEVELVTYRTEKLHDGCKGFWRASGQPERITAYGINKAIWTHVCSECGQTNRMYDVCWPQFRREWRAVK